MINKKSAIIITCLCLIGIVAFIIRLNIRYLGECIISEPPRVSGGDIKTVSSGPFNDGFEAYFIWYEGKFENYDELCIQRVRVTKKGYEKQIYGD